MPENAYTPMNDSQFQILLIKMDAISALMTERYNNTSHRIDRVEENVDDHNLRISVLEKNKNQDIGGRNLFVLIFSTLIGIAGIIAATFGEWSHKLFH